MRSVVACARTSALALTLVLGVLGGVSAAAAQPAPPTQTLAARCDLPVVVLFNPMAGDVLQPGDYLISGLALDPMAQAGASGIDQIAFFLGSRDQGGTPLGSTVPNSGARSADFSLNVTLPSANPGTPQVLEAYAHSALTGKETEVSLPVVVGSGGTASMTPDSAAANSVNTNPGTLPDACSTPDLGLPVNKLAQAPTASALPVDKSNPGSTSLFGTILGLVTSCENGAEEPVNQATVAVQGTSVTGTTDPDGLFAIPQVPAPGTYTVQVSDGGGTAQRMYVTVVPGEKIDIGTLQMGADPFTGCPPPAPPTN